MWYLSLVHHKNSRKFWHKSHSKIKLFVPPGLIKSSTSCSTALYITKSSVTRGQTDTYPLTYLSVTSYWKSSQSNTNLYKHHTAHHYSSTSHLSTSYHFHISKNVVPTYVIVSTNIPLFAPHLWYSIFLTLNLLTFKPSHTTHELLTSARTRTYTTSFYFVKIVNPKFAILHS